MDGTINFAEENEQYKGLEVQKPRTQLTSKFYETPKVKTAATVNTNTQSNDFTSEVENVKANATASMKEYWEKKQTAADIIANKRATNSQYYQFNLPPDQYDFLNNRFAQIAKDEGPEAADEARYKYMNAMQYSRLYSIPLEEAMQNVDVYNRSIFNDATEGNYKGKAERLGDALTSGLISLERGWIGAEWKKAEDNGDVEGAKKIKEYIDALDEAAQEFAINQPQAIPMAILTSGIQSLPYTAAVSAAGFVSGKLGGKWLGYVGSIATASLFTMGDEYIELRNMGVEPEVANKIALGSGVVQGTIESFLGNVAGWIGRGAKGVTGGTTKRLSQPLIEKVSKDFYSLFKTGDLGLKAVVKLATEYGTELTEEGLEEFAQQWTSWAGQKLAQALSMNDVEVDNFEEAWEKSKDAFIGGVEGAILLGLPGLAYDAGVTISDFKKVKEDAELIDSKEVFLKAEKDNAIFKNVSEEDYKKVAGEVWDNFSKKRQEAEKELSMEIQEGLAAEEGTEEYEAEGPDGEEELKAEYRQDGRLYTTNNVTGEDTDGKTTGRFAVGNPEEKNNNTFGYLNYTIDEEAGTVTINDFKMAPQREYLRAETYNEFAQQFSGYDIKWDPKTKRVQMMKESLMNLNPRGKEAGLNYFETGSEENHKARVQVAQQLKSEYSFLTDEQAAVDVAVMDILSKRIGMDVSTFFDKAFHNREMFGASEDLEAGIRQAVAEGRLNEGEAVNGAATFKQFNDGMRSIIYTSKNADFSTWSHEVTHVWKNLLTTIADDKTNKQAQDIISKLNAIYDKDFRNWTEKEEEDFVRGFEAYLGSRNNEAGGKFNEVYKQLAKFMAEVYKWLEDHGVTFNEKFKEAYDAMLQTEGSELAQARKAVEEANAQEAQKQQEEAAVKEEATQENLTAETKAEIKEADKIVKDVDYGIEDKVDATVQATSDQYAENVEAEKEEAWEREMEENPDAFDENGDLLIFQRTEAEYKAAWEELETFPLEEKNRIKNNFVKFKGTPWYHAALESLMIRYDLKALMNGTPTCGSKLMGKAGTKLREYIQRAKDTNGDFYEALYDWAAHTGVGLIGQADKAEFAVNSTFLNCDPSMDCAEYCYAATGTYNFAGAAIRSEVVSMVIEMYPERAAEEVFYQYRPTGGNKMGNVLRLFDKGDISENWIPFIEKLNAKGLRTQIFSKRPAILSKVDPVMNVIMLSIDRTNRELAENNKDFPIAFVLQDEEDIKWIERNVDRFRKHGGVILPVQLSNGSIEESKALVKLLPQEIRPYVCPVDGGYAVLKYPENGKSYVENAKELGPIHHCGGCNSKGGIGCLFHRTQMWLESHGQWIDTTPLELKEGEKLYEELEKQRQTIDKAAAEGHLNEELAKQLREQLATLNAGIRKLIDRRGENGSLNGNARRSEETPGINEGRIESEVKFQRVTDPKELEWLNSQPTEKYYRTVIAGEVDGKQAFWPPMSSKVSAAGEKTRKLREPIFLNEWEKAEERPDLVDDKGYFTLAKDNGKSIDALYAPYMHSSPSMLNDQLAESQERPNLAVVEVEVPASELSGEDPYTAPKSKKSVGRYDWKAGVIQSQLTGTREVNLSRWDKIVRVVPPAEVAANIVKEFGDQKIVMPTNVVTPQVRAELEKLGVEFVKTDNKNTLLEGPHAGDKYTWWYGPNAEENRRKGYLKAGREFEQTRFQTAYHGSAADFEKFDLNYNKSGEGSNAFGYGVYLTGSKVIAKDYAERQGDTKFDKQAPGEYRGQDVAHIRDYMNTGLTFQAAKEKRITYLESNKARYALTYGPNSSMAKVWQNKIDFVKELTEEDLNSRNLYTVEIPEENYLKWDEKVAPIMLEDIKKAVYDYLIQIDNDGDYEGSAKEYLEKELDITFNEYTTGESAYKSVAGFLKSELKASWLLNKIGIKGIDYPAGTHFDTEEDARNYVIFDENLVQIMDHLRFQTEQDLLKDAAQFDSWQNFMEMYTSDFGQAFDHSQVPSGADAVWYQSVWEKARNISPTIGEQLEEMAKQDSLRDKEAPIEDTAMDAMFTAEMRQEGSTMLEDFLREVDNILKTDVDVAAETEEDQKDLQRIESLQRVIRQTLRHGVWLSNAARVNKDKGLTDRMKRQMLTLIEHSVRAYRTIYSEVMNDEYWKPTEEDPSIKKIRGSKYNALAAGKDITNMSPEQLRKIARDITNKEISEKIKNGSLKIETDVENYLKQLESDIKATDKDFEKLQNETAEDYKNMSDWEQRRILEVYDELVLANPKYEKKDKVKNEVAKAIKTAEKYNTNFYKNATANYDTIFRQWEDLRKLVEANAKLKEAIRRRDDLVKLAEERAAKKTEKAAVDRMKEVRKQLVKRAMRRVPFSRIMYDQAKTLIAIQRVFEPNLEGGVNKWIGTEGSWPRMVWSQYLTDADFRDRISKRLLRTKTGIKVLNKLETTKTDEDFNSWTNSERRSLMKVAPKEDWVRDLHLVELDEEREESIDIPIEYEERRRSYKDDKGNTKWEKYILPKLDDEVGKLIKDALGPDMFNTLLYKPFAEWTTNEMELLAKRVDEIYIEGREALAAKREAEKELSKEIRKRIQDAVTNTGIVINDDDPPEVKAEKQKAINKKLGLTSEMKGTAASSLQRENIFNRILHGYSDATVRRVARILDNYSEGVNTNLLYHEEANCYNEEQNQIQRRTKKIQDSMVRNNISPLDLAQPVIFKNFKKGNDIKLTLDELLYFLAANLDEKSRDACAYGNLYDEKEREEYKRLDEDFQKAFEESEEKAKEAGKKGNLQEVQKAQAISSKYVDESGNLQKPGTTAYRAVCDSLWARLMLVTEQDQNGNLIIIPAERGNEARFIPVIAELLTESHFDGKKATAEEKEAYKNQMLEKKFISFIQDVMDDYNVEFDRMSKASIDEFNQPVNRVQRYVPIVRMSMTGDTNENRVRADLLATNAGAQSNAGTDRGMTKKRIDVAALYQRPVEAGLFKTWSDALGRTEHFIAYAPYVRELNRVYMSRNAQSTMQWIESRYGKGMTEYIRDYIQEVANPNRGQVQTATDRFVRSLRGLTAPAYLGWKASSVFKQAVTSPWPFMSEVTPVEYVNALFKQIRNGSTFEEGIKAKSNFMRERRMDPIMDLIDEQVKKNLDSKAKSFLLDMESLGMKPLEWIDWVCVAPGWQAVYTREYNKLMSDNEAKREREAAIIKEKQPGIDDVTLEKMLEEKLMSAVEIEEAAVKAADDVVRMTQPSNRKADLAPIFKNNNEVAKAVLQFTTSLNVIWNNLRYDLPYEVRRENYSKAIKYVTEYALAGICLSLLAGQLPLPGDDKDEVVEKLRALLHGATTQFTDSIPFIGSAVTNVAEKLITGKSQYSSGSDLFPTISKALQGIGNVTQGDWDKAVAKWAEAVGISMGLPVSGSKELLYFFGIGDGEEEFKIHPTAILGQRN